jgi:hypothetical protein
MKTATSSLRSTPRRTPRLKGPSHIRAQSSNELTRRAGVPRTEPSCRKGGQPLLQPLEARLQVAELALQPDSCRA